MELFPLRLLGLNEVLRAQPYGRSGWRGKSNPVLKETPAKVNNLLFYLNYQRRVFAPLEAGQAMLLCRRYAHGGI